MTKFLFWGDAAVPTGFGTVTHNIGDRLIARGHDVAVLGINDRGDPWPTAIRRYRANMLDPMDLYGASRIVELLGRELPDVVVIVNDPAIVTTLLLDNKYDPDGVLFRGVQNGERRYRPPILAYLTADGEHPPRTVDLLLPRVTRIAMSHFGQRVAYPEAPVVWHGVDTSIYHPENRTQAKRILGYDPDTFLVVRADKNSQRKDYASTYRALRPVLRTHKDVAVHFHCLPKATDGYDIRAVMWNDEDIRDRVNFSANLGGYTGWPEEHLALLLAAADLYVSTSWGEGFGLTLIQSLACGTPVIATDCSAITEVVGPGGILVPPGGTIVNPMGQEMALPDIDGFTAAIERFYRSRKLRKQLGSAAVEHASQFSWDVATDKIEQIAADAIARNGADPKEKPPAVA